MSPIQGYVFGAIKMAQAENFGTVYEFFSEKILYTQKISTLQDFLCTLEVFIVGFVFSFEGIPPTITKWM
jgi:hypothetical protein